MISYELDLKKDYSERIPYNLPKMPVYIGKEKVVLDCGLAGPPHWHEDVEFNLILSGTAYYNIDGECFRLNGGEGIFVNSGRLHYGFCPDRCDYETVLVIFRPSLICPNNHVEQKFINPLINNSSFSHAVLTSDVTWKSDVFNKVLEAFNVFCYGHHNMELELLNRFYQLWSMLLGNMPSDGNDNGDYCIQNNSFREMLTFIHINYAQKITLDDIAAAGKVCRTKCGEIFRNNLRQSPIDYLTTYRLRRAISLLEDTSESVSSISACTGFSGASYFSETFRKYHKCSPSEYRLKVSGTV